MTKEVLINRITKMVYRIALEKGLDVENKGLGHQYDNTYWKWAKDESGIPTIMAHKDDYSIEFRPVFSSMEIDIRRKDGNGDGELLVLQFSDYERNIHTGDFKVSEVRVDAHNYRECIDEIYAMVDTLLEEE